MAMNVNCLRRAHEGEALTAEEYEESSGKATAVCKIKVTNGEGRLLRFFYTFASRGLRERVKF
ncbi:MAG: hypothetical protein H5T33_03065 [Candidatus Methanosuratus sp.]|nr:hypothetical protein [Candidatus Methanosuratincola sp.]